MKQMSEQYVQRVNNETLDNTWLSPVMLNAVVLNAVWKTAYVFVKKMNLPALGLCAGIVAIVLGVFSQNLVADDATAQTVRWARQGDSLTIDPHSQNEGATHNLAHQYYETLMISAPDGSLEPTLATKWSVTSDPMVWEFTLRRGVKFHDGSPFTAKDVVFSIKRAKMPTSDMRELLGSVRDVKAQGDYTVRIITKNPDPILPQRFTNLFMMSEAWAKKYSVMVPQDYASGNESYATRNANGTGPYQLIEREPGNRTVLRRFDDYWGKDKFPLDVETLIYLPISSNPTRVAALLSGELEFLQDVPASDVARLKQEANIRINTGAENRSIFLGMDQAKDDLKFDNITGRNPFSDVRVRQAMNIAIDRNIIKRVTMRGESEPSGMIITSFVNGWSPELNAIPAYDIGRAQSLLQEAGYPNGFSIVLHCPNNRYVNDEGICQAIAGMLGRIGIRVSVSARPKSQHFADLLERKIEFYMLGWSVPTHDSGYVFDFLFHTTTKNNGTWNATGYSNFMVDSLTAQIAGTVDLDKRNDLIRQIWETVRNDRVYLPIHNQTISWAMDQKFDIKVDPENQVFFKYVELRE